MWIKKQASSFDIEIEMEKELLASHIEKEGGFSKLAKAIDMLNVVAEIFDDAGLSDQSEQITEILESIASSNKKSKKLKSDKATTGLTSEKMVENLKHKGWVFNANDGGDLNVSDDEDTDLDEDFEDE